MGVVAPSSGHCDAGAALCVGAAVGAVAAGVERRGAATQEAAVRPAVPPVAEVGGPGAAVPGAQLHRRGLHTTAQVHLWTPRARRRSRVQPNRGVKGEEVHLEAKREQQVTPKCLKFSIFPTDSESIITNQLTRRTS